MKRRWKIALGVGVAAGGAAAGLWAMGGDRPEGAALLPPLDGAPRRLAVGDTLVAATWNTHYGYGPTLERGRGLSRAIVIDNLERMAAQIRSWGADIVALQEVDRDSTRAYGIDQLAWLRRAVGLPFGAVTDVWNARWVPYPSTPLRQQIGRVRSSMVVLSRLPLSAPVRHALPQPAARGALYNRFNLHRAVLQLRAEWAPGRYLTVSNTHFEAFDRVNCEEHARIAAELLAAAGPDVLLLGDLNTVPPEASLRHGFEDEPDTDMRQDRAIEILRAVPGLREVVTEQQYLAEQARYHTFPAWAPNRRLDYIFHGPGLVTQAVEVPGHDNPPSDHLPVVARFRVGPAGRG